MDELKNSSNQLIGKVEFEYTDLLLSEVSITDSTNTQVGVAAYTFDKDSLMETAGALDYTRSSTTGLITSSTIGNLSESFTYDSTYAETNAYSVVYSGTTKYSYSITRDLLGRIDEVTENVLGTSTTYDYIYDSSGRLSEVKVGGVTVSENTYDSNSNRVSGDIGSQSFTAAYDAHERLTDWNNYDYTYNKNGERISKTNTSNSDVTTYGWDTWGKLKTVTLPNTDEIKYKFDGAGRKTATLLNNSVESYYLYQDDLKLVAVLDASGEIVSQFVWGEKVNVPEYMIKSGTTYRLISDARGSVRLVMNATNGTVAQRMDYDEWGRVTNDASPGFQHPLLQLQ